MQLLNKIGYLASAAAISCTANVENNNTYYPDVIHAPEVSGVEILDISSETHKSIDVSVGEKDVSSIDQEVSSKSDTSFDVNSGSDLGVDITNVPSGLSSYLSQEQFDSFFVNKNDPPCKGSYYSYQAFLSAAQKYPEFLSEGTKEQRLQELAAFLANISHETTGGWPTAPGGPYAWGLCFKEEDAYANAPAGIGVYCVDDPNWPCAPGVKYFGRGPMQISYNYNYGPAGVALGIDLLNHPEIVAQDGEVAFSTALWFWMTPQNPKPSCHDVMAGKWTPSPQDVAAGRLPGFGQTVNIINGGVECGKGLQNPPQENQTNLKDRLGYFAYFSQKLAVDPGQNVDCNMMQHY